MMDKILTFRVGIDGLEDKIWREIEIHDRMTVADLAYTILASFNSLAYHLYNIKYKKMRYDCKVDDEFPFDDEKIIDATKTKLSDLKLKEKDTLEMEYDYGSTTTFHIIFLGSKRINMFDVVMYPFVSKGEGLSMLDDMSDFDLKKIVEETDKLGYSEYYFTPGYEKEDIYDYRNYDIDSDNELLKGRILAIKNGYEVE